MLLLKMEMPDNCYHCPFCDYEQGLCLADGAKMDDGFFSEGRRASENKDKRAEWCPIKGKAKPSRHGEWIEEEHETISEKGRLFHAILVSCSYCGKPNGRHRVEYCPHCGARMDGRRKKK